MNVLLSLITFLILVVVGFAATAMAIIIILAIGIYAYKTSKLLIALLNAAIKEPEEKLVKKVRHLNKGKK